jgi:hypothetical protein
MDFKDWLTETLSKYGLSDLDVQNKTEINRSLVWQYKQGIKKPKIGNIGLLATLLSEEAAKAENLSDREVYFLRLELVYKMFEMLEAKNNE